MEFMKLVRKVVDLFEQHQYDKDEIKQGQRSSNDTKLASSNSDENYVNFKYLTSSQLFELQLKDPMLRQQISMQLLFFIHFLRYFLISL